MGFIEGLAVFFWRGAGFRIGITIVFFLCVCTAFNSSMSAASGCGHTPRVFIYWYGMFFPIYIRACVFVCAFVSIFFACVFVCSFLCVFGVDAYVL